MTFFEIRQCGNELCRFRFPTAVGEKRGHWCPLCGTPTVPDVAPYEGHDVPMPAAPAQRPFVSALLDNIRSLYNVGSIFRTADGIGLHHLYLCGLTGTPENPRLRKTALDAENSVAWSYHRNALDLAQTLKAQGILLWGIEGGDRAEPLFAADFALVLTQEVVLVVGNELAGIDPALLALCDRVFCLPMNGRKASLNVTIAFGAVAYFVHHQLHSLVATS